MKRLAPPALKVKAEMVQVSSLPVDARRILLRGVDKGWAARRRQGGVRY